MGFSDIFTSIANVATGGLAKEIISKVSEYFPPDMSAEQKAVMELEIQKLTFAREVAVDKAIEAAEDSVNKRIEIYEGTAKDLLAVPIFGALMLFLRGSQRTIWGFATIYFDYEWLVKNLQLSEQQQTALIIINLLVLGFLFGERAVKNLAPLITDMIAAKKG